MYKQTNDLCSSLPHFAELFKAADRIGSAQWQIIRWEDIDLAIVRPEQVKVISEPFRSRTEALDESCARLKHLKRGRSEKEHYGVWKWVEDGKTHYQSVMPAIKYEVGQPGKPMAVKEGNETSSSTMVRISEKANAILRRMADADGKTLQAVLDDALQEYEKQRFFKDLNAAYQALRDDPKAWAEELKERALWENTLMDDLDTDEIWHEDGTVTIRETERKSA